MAAIIITKGDPQTGNLTMKDSIGNSASTFHARKGDIITWQIEPTSGVSKITAIDKKEQPGNQNIFSSLPAKLGNSQNWQGTISKSPPVKQEIYFIKWQDKGGTKCTYDPLIQIDP